MKKKRQQNHCIHIENCLVTNETEFFFGKGSKKQTNIFDIRIGNTNIQSNGN